MTGAIDMTETRSRNPFAVRDFRRLWAGQAVSVLGDQFALIALPSFVSLLSPTVRRLGLVPAFAPPVDGEDEASAGTLTAEPARA